MKWDVKSKERGCTHTTETWLISEVFFLIFCAFLRQTDVHSPSAVMRLSCPFSHTHKMGSLPLSFSHFSLGILYDYFKVLQPAGTQVPTSNINLADFSADDFSFSLPSKVPVCPLKGGCFSLKGWWCFEVWKKELYLCVQSMKCRVRTGSSTWGSGE